MNILFIFVLNILIFNQIVIFLSKKIKYIKYKEILGNKNADKISIVIPFLNEEKILLSTLKKITNIGLKGELILIDNNSTDNSANILQEFEKNYNGANKLEIIKLFCPKKGKGNALYLGLKKSRYNTILISDADNELEINKYPLLIKKYQTLDDKYAELVAVRDYVGNHKFLHLDILP